MYKQKDDTISIVPWYVEKVEHSQNSAIRVCGWGQAPKAVSGFLAFIYYENKTARTYEPLSLDTWNHWNVQEQFWPTRVIHLWGCYPQRGESYFLCPAIGKPLPTVKIDAKNIVDERTFSNVYPGIERTLSLKKRVGKVGPNFFLMCAQYRC